VHDGYARALNEDRTNWAPLAAVDHLVKLETRVEPLPFDRRHFGNGDPMLHRRQQGGALNRPVRTSRWVA